MTEYDVIVVYDGRLARSAANTVYTEAAPFAAKGANPTCNASYQYFLQYCKQQGLRAAFATTHDISGAGTFKSVWVFNKHWQRKLQPAHTDLVFDKFSGLAKRNIEQFALLTSKPGKVKLFHDPKIREIFDNKLKTYKHFADYAIPTVKIDLVSPSSITTAKAKLHVRLWDHKNKKDFSDTFVLKDQFGAGGINIFKVQANKDYKTIGTKSALISFVLQPFIESSGFTFGKHRGKIDLRVIICNGKIVQSYIRVAKAGEFRANAKQGGTVVYITNEMIPPDVKVMIKNIHKTLPTDNTFYALDFIKSDRGNLYFVEGNITPGLNWFDAEDEVRVKQLIHLVVKNLKTMV